MSATDLLVDGAKIRLWSKKTGRCLRIQNDGGDINGNGGNGKFATFIVHVKDSNVLLESEASSSHWLAIKNDNVATGTGGKFCEFQAIDHGPGYISLESMEHRGKYVGIKSDGNAGVKDRTNDYTKFYVIIDTPGDQEVPRGSRLLVDGAKVRLWGFAHGGNLSISEDGSVDGIGKHGQYAQFTVHSRGNGVVSLQNVKIPNHWIAIKNDETVGTGSGGKYTHLRVHDSENGTVCLESVEHPGQHLGILDDGTVKPPGNTGKGKHGRFHVILDVMG